MTNAIDGAVANAPTTTTAATTTAGATTEGATTASGTTTAAVASRQKRGTRSVVYVTNGIEFIYVYRMMKAFVAAMSRTIYSTSVYMMSRTILFTLGTKPVMAPSYTVVQQMTSMSTSLVTIKSSVSATRVQNLQEMDDNNEEPSVKLADYNGTLQVGKVTQVDEHEVVEKDESKNYLATLKGLLANRDGLQKTVLLLIKIVEKKYIIDSSTDHDIHHIFEKAEGIDALANCLYGAEMKRTVIFGLAAELYRYAGYDLKIVAAPTEEEIASFITIIQHLNVQIVAISKVIMETQTLVIRHVGAKFDPKTMVSYIISVEQANYGSNVTFVPTVEEETSSTAILSASEEQAKLESEVSSLKVVLVQIEWINVMLQNIQSGALTADGTGEETIGAVVMTWLIDIVVLITEERFTSTEFTTLYANLQSVTKVSTLTEIELKTITSLIQVVTLIVSTKTGAAAGASQKLIGAKGLLVEEISTDIPFEEQTEAADKQLATNRANCKGMDDVAKALKKKQAELTPVCKDKFDPDCDVEAEAAAAASALIEKIILLTSTSSANIEDATILTLTQQIITMISSITIITLEQTNLISAQVLTIQSTVLIYVSQISIVESKKFEVGGEIKFPGAPAEAPEGDFEGQKDVLKTKLSNLMICGDSNDRVIECISTIENLPDDPEGPSIKDDLQDEAEKVPAMCSAPEPPVVEVQKTSASIVGLCQTLQYKPAPGQLKSLTFIKQSLVTFKQTFTEQITTFSQKWSDITGESVTAASLGIKVISDTGELTEAVEIDISGGLEINSVEFYQKRYEIVKSSISTLTLVVTRITEVIQISSDTCAEGGTSPLDFALLVADLSTELSSGVITQKVIDLSVKILQAEVTCAPSNAILIMLRKASSTVSKLQISLLSEVVVIKQQLVMKLTELKISITTITFTIQQVSSTGEIIEITEAASASQDSASFAELKSLSTTMVESRKSLASVNLLLSSLKDMAFSSITGTVEISITMFMQKISMFMVLISQGFASEQISTLGAELLTYKIASISVAYITQLKFMISTIVTYSVQVTIEVTMISKQMSTASGAFVEEITTENQLVLKQVKSNFESFSSLLETAKGSTNLEGATTAAQFLQISLEFVILIEESVTSGFVSIASQITTQITTIQTMSTTVMPFSGKHILLIDGMVTSINIYMIVLEQIIVPIGSTPGVTGPPPTTEEEATKPPIVVITEGPVAKPQDTTTVGATTIAFDCGTYTKDYFCERNFMYNSSIKNLQDVKKSISGAIGAINEGLETFSLTEEFSEAQPVNSSVYIKALDSIIMDLSIDMTNIDAERVSEFISLSLDLQSFSEPQIESLSSIKATLTSYISQLASEIAMAHSFIQDLQIRDGFDGGCSDGYGYGQDDVEDGETMGLGEDEDMESLMSKEAMMADNIEKLNQTVEYMINIENNCDMENDNSPMEYINFVIDMFYLPLINTDMMQMNSLWGSVEFGTSPLSDFEMYNDQGIRCMNETQQRDMMAVRVVLKVYIEMAELHRALIHEEMLEMDGECPAGYELGDWSDGTGECCCDPSAQPQMTEPEDGEEPIEIPLGGYGEEPIEIGSYGEEPIEIGGGGYGEEPIEITGEGDGEEPVEIPFGNGEEPILIGGYGEEPIEIGGEGEEPIQIGGEGEEPIEIGGGGEEPIQIGGGEEPIEIGYGGGEEPVPIGEGYGEEPITIGEGYGEEPVSLSGGESPVTIGNGTTMIPSSSTATGSRRRGRREAHMSTTTVGPTGQTPISIIAGYGDGEEPVTVGYGDGEEPITVGYGNGEEPITLGYGDGEEPVTIGNGYGGEEPITIGNGYGEEPVTIGEGYGEEPVTIGEGYGEEPVTIGEGYGEEPVTIGEGYGEEPVSVGVGGYGEGEEPMEVTSGFTGEQPMEVTGYGGENPITVDPVEPVGPVEPEQNDIAKCFPKKKFCKCRSGSTPPPSGTTSPRPRPTGSTGPDDFVMTARPTPGNLINDQHCQRKHPSIIPINLPQVPEPVLQDQSLQDQFLQDQLSHPQLHSIPLIQQVALIQI